MTIDDEPHRAAPPTSRSVGAQLGGLAVSVALVAVVAGLGASWTDTRPGSWYQQLEQPPWNPPDWVFGPVWGVLYLAMAAAAWLLWRPRVSRRRRSGALAWYGLQLVLNLGWTGLFFGLERPGWALVEIIGLIAAVAMTIARFHPHHHAAAWLLAPYLGWVIFASTINAGVVALN